MSGDKKKRASRGQGWEEAKDEFYQESFPTNDADLEAFERDPRKIATLLPSKQTRGTLATRKINKNGKDKGTVKRRTTSRSVNNTVRRQSVTQDNYVAMLPDLSENLSTEETTWKEIMMIKASPVSLAEKKEMKAKLNSATKLRLQGYEQFKWRWRKFMKQLNANWEEAFAKLELWKTSLKKIEGKYGTGVVTYFQFIKWLIFLNTAIFILLFLFVILPTLILTEAAPGESCSNSTLISTCAANRTEKTNTSSLDDILDFIQGTGWMEDTYVFFGIYDCYILKYPGQRPYFYNLPFAYILCTISVFILSLVCIVKAAARGFRERLLEGEGQYYQFCNLVFGGWDFCIQNEKSAKLKQKALYNEIKSHLMEEKLKEEVKQRSSEAATKLLLIRLLVHALVLVLLAGSAALIYYAFSFSKTELEKSAADGQSWDRLLLEYFPSITIVALNTIVPIVVKYLAKFERYSPIGMVRMTMLRTVFLRLASLLVLIITLRSLISCDCTKGCQQLRCWETYVGQNFYKLVLLDFASHVLITFFINFPRMLFAQHCPSRCTILIGEQEFDLPKHVLDVVYSQTLCWLGFYFAPLLPAIVAIYLVFIFYIKKFVCMVNTKPSSTVHLASRSKSMFMAILLVAFFVGLVPVGLGIGEIAPSAQCGPFRGRQFVWDVVLEAFQTLPADLRSFIFYLGTAGFAVPAFIVLGLALYYFYAVSEANKHMVTVLKSQLILEGHDKQFLLERLSALVEQHAHAERRKQARSVAPNPDFSIVTDNSNVS